MNAKTLLVAVQTRSPRVITLLVHFRAHVPLVTTRTIKADVKVNVTLFVPTSFYTFAVMRMPGYWICWRSSVGHLISTIKVEKGTAG